MVKPVSSALSSPTVDIVIPVYKNLDITSRCIESVLSASSKIRYCLIVVNDASPEPEVTLYLANLAGANKIILIENKENKGFVQSVNIGMQQHLQRDVVLLNSDTIVANDWLDRLYQCAHKESNIATVTPFSNNATICSYPKSCEENTLPAEYSLSELDSFFASCNSGEYMDIPTAVGFCMFIKRDCLSQIGYFDEKRFGKGYGEENEFCLRAIKRGWRNVIACDVFVYHEGSVSFGASKSERIEAAQKTLQKLYPRYNALVHKFIVQDKLLPFRHRVDLRRLGYSKLASYLFIMHEGGGGVLKHVQDLIKHFDSQINFLILIPEENYRIKLYWANNGESFCLYFNFKEIFLIIELLKNIRINRVHIHHIAGWKDSLTDLIAALALPYDVTIHDYYHFCPQITVTTKQGHYCGLPELAACQKCVNDRWETRGIDVADWRKKNQTLLEKAARVFVPDASVLSIFNRYFDKINFILAPHLEKDSLNQAPYLRPCLPEEPLKILILGALSQIKGADVVDQCAQFARKNAQPLEFHLLGFVYHKLQKNDRLRIHGKYEEKDLQKLIKDVNPHLAWFPSLCPETYSYTLSACLAAQLPVVSTDLGAQAERIRGRALSFTKTWQTTPQEWNEFFMEFKLREASMSEFPAKKAADKQYFDYSVDYLTTIDAHKKLDLPSNGILEQIYTIKGHDFKYNWYFLKHKTYFFLLGIYTKMGIGFFLPREKLIFIKLIMQKTLLSRR